MRPDAVEIIRGLQTALMMHILPEVQTPFGQEQVQLTLFLLENLAQDWDTATENLVRDNRQMQDIFRQAAVAIRALPRAERPRQMRGLISALRAAARGGDGDSLAISALAQRHRQLQAVLERLLVACEDAVGNPRLQPLMPIRQQIYAHLRQVCSRGWTVWDTLSFRDRMASVRAG